MKWFKVTVQIEQAYGVDPEKAVWEPGTFVCYRAANSEATAVSKTERALAVDKFDFVTSKAEEVAENMVPRVGEQVPEDEFDEEVEPQEMDDRAQVEEGQPTHRTHDAGDLKTAKNLVLRLKRRGAWVSREGTVVHTDATDEVFDAAIAA